MVEAIDKGSRKVGLPPGTLMHVGETSTAKVQITVLDYDAEEFAEQKSYSPEKCLPFRDTDSVTWINVDGIHNLGTLRKIGEHFGLHPLTLEDIASTDQRPKLEDFDHYLYLVVKMPYFDEEDDEVKVEQLSIILTNTCVISFQEREGDVFNPIRDWLRTNRGRIRKMGPDYLAYSLLDAIVDSYFEILERFGEKLEPLEEELIADPKPDTLKALYELRSDLIVLRKSAWPLRDVLNRLCRGATELIKESTLIYMRDVYDHTVRVIDSIETSRDTLSAMLDVYLSSVSNRMNEVIKVLTIIATVFIPLTFITGVYGMNFKRMPETESAWGYPVVCGVMLVIAVAMLIYFRKRRWL